MVLVNREPVLVSVIMPLYNAERFIAAALGSILQERSIPLEVIVVNDGSTDASLNKLQKLKDPRVQVINNTGKGIATAYNTGLAAARGKIIARCDADDLYPRQRLIKQIEWLEQNPEYGAVCGSFSVIDAHGSAVISFDHNHQPEDLTEELQNGNTRTHFCTFAVRSEVLQTIGGCRPYFSTAEDIDLQLRIGSVCKVWFLPQICYQYRLHNASITHTRTSTEREFFESIAREFQRQRSLSGTDDLEQGCPPAPPTQNSKPPLSAAQHIQGLLLGRAWREYREGTYFQASITAIRAALMQPQNFSVWRSAVALWVKSLQGERLAASKQT